MSANDSKYPSKLIPIRIRSESGTENVHYPLLYEGLPKEAELYAQRKLNETDENKAKGIRKLKEYMKRENLLCPDDRMLIMVLRNCKYNLKKSETKLKKFLKLRQLTIDKLARMDMKYIRLLLEQSLYRVLPYRDKNGRVIVYTEPDSSVEKYEHEDLAICGIACIMYVLSFPMSCIYGVTHLGECQTPHLPVFYQIFKFLKLFLPLSKDLPIRLARVDLFNEHFLCRWGINMIRPFLPDKVKSRVMFHGSGLEGVHKIFQPDMLPCEIGGTVASLSPDYYIDDLMCFIERLREEKLVKDRVGLHTGVGNLNLIEDIETF